MVDFARTSILEVIYIFLTDFLRDKHILITISGYIIKQIKRNAFLSHRYLQIFLFIPAGL